MIGMVDELGASDLNLASYGIDLWLKSDLCSVIASNDSNFLTRSSKLSPAEPCEYSVRRHKS